jgi:uncharacterized protein
MTVRDNPTELRYELLDGETLVGLIRYRLEPNAIALIHTEVEPAHEGQGLAGVLVQGALDDIRARGLRLIPICPYVRSWLGRHPEYADLVTRDPAAPD